MAAPQAADAVPAWIEQQEDGGSPGRLPSAHERIATQVEAMSSVTDRIKPSRFTFHTGDSFETISRLLVQHAGRAIGPCPTWVRITDLASGHALIAVLHSPNCDQEAEITIAADAGMLVRSTIRALCRWVFGVVGLLRVTARVPAGDAALADLLRRAGFEHEGRLRDVYGLGADATLWAMVNARCPWLPRPASAIPTADTSPPSSFKVH